MIDGGGRQHFVPRAGSGEDAPIIVTAAMAAADAAWATALRERHFPPERNHLAAHITLFHHLPPSLLGELDRRLASLTSASPPVARVMGWFSLGRGVALRLSCPELLALRAELAEAFAPLLTPQDRAVPRLHITIQNKVTVETARATLEELSAQPVPPHVAIAGIETHFYRGGPWETIRRHSFRGARR